MRMPQTMRAVTVAGMVAGLTLVARADFMVRNGDKVVFYGDSITDTEWYPTLVESYVLTRYPTWRNHFSNRGVSGDNSGSMARFERDVIAQTPDLFTYNMGYNDAGYAALTSAGLEKWLGNIEKSVALARQANPAVRLVLVSPIPNEVSVSKDPRWVSHEVYPYVLLSFGREEARLAQRLGVPFVDVGLLYGQSVGLGQVAAGASFCVSRDGVHPQREGQALIAFHLLRGLGAEAEVATVVIDAVANKVEQAKRCQVAEFANREEVLSFRRTCEALPYPIPPEVRPFAFLVRMEDNLSADLLTVKGLPAPAYTLFVDDRRIADISAPELAEGVNLSRYPDTPMSVQALAVMDAVRQKQVLEIVFWRQWIGSGKADGAGHPTDKATPEDRTAMDIARKAIAAAEAACYALNTPKPHTIRLEPGQAKVARFDALVAAAINQAPLSVSVSQLDVDWNSAALLGKEVTVTVANAATVPRTGTCSWVVAGSWAVTPASVPFTVEPGKKTVLNFALAAVPGAAMAPAPEVSVRWRWTPDWPYPMQIVRPLEIKPHLTIAHAAVKPTLAGNLDDWKDATTFTLDNEYFIDPAVPGKKLLWGGPADLSAQLFMKWDEAALYVAVLARDDEHLQNTNEMMMWSQDVMMAALLLSEKGKPDGRYEFGFGAYADRDAIARYSNAAKDATGPDLQFKSRVDKEKGTCLYEVVFPWNRLPPFLPAADREFRFTFVLGEADSQVGKGFNYLAWTPGINYGKNPADFAVIKLAPAK